MNRTEEEFYRLYGIKVLNDTKVGPKLVPADFFTDPSNAALVLQDNKTNEGEKILTIEIPESRLKVLFEMERQFFKWQDHTSKEVDLFDLIVRKEREEAKYRDTNESVKKAYEQYSLMLHLAGHNKKQ